MSPISPQPPLRPSSPPLALAEPPPICGRWDRSAWFGVDNTGALALFDPASHQPAGPEGAVPRRPVSKAEVGELPLGSALLLRCLLVIYQAKCGSSLAPFAGLPTRRDEGRGGLLVVNKTLGYRCSSGGPRPQGLLLAEVDEMEFWWLSQVSRHRAEQWRRSPQTKLFIGARQLSTIALAREIQAVRRRAWHSYGRRGWEAAELYQRKSTARRPLRLADLAPPLRKRLPLVQLPVVFGEQERVHIGRHLPPEQLRWDRQLPLRARANDWFWRRWARPLFLGTSTLVVLAAQLVLSYQFGLVAAALVLCPYWWVAVWLA